YRQDDDGDWEGYDRFGRVKDQFWDGFSGTSDADRITYTHDYAGNRLTRDIASSIYATNDKDQKYTYDGLHRLTNFDRGTLSSGSIASPNREQDWTLSQLGNWENFVEKTSGSTDLDQTRTHNDVNEITGISEAMGNPVWIDPVYNGAGNLTEAPAPG